MTNEELDEARAVEAYRIYSTQFNEDGVTVSRIAARLAREGWTPPEPVDPDLLAAREWAKTTDMGSPALYDDGSYDTEPEIIGFLAGCTRGREEAKGLVAAAEGLAYVLEATWPNLANTEPVRALRAALASAKRGG